MIRTSEATDELMGKLAAAQSKMGAAIKNAANPAFRSKYADLSAVIDATMEHLNKEGIAVMQHPALEVKGTNGDREAYVTVTTRLQYGAQWMESDMSIPAIQRERFDAQSVGSAITYGCRYALQSILVVPREDDDANAASGRGTHEQAQEVGRKKVEALQASKAQQPPFLRPTTLFYTYPERHQGNYAEWVNIKEYAGSLEGPAAEGLRQVFAPRLSKSVAKNGTTLVPKEKMPELLEILAGECGIDLKELKPGD